MYKLFKAIKALLQKNTSDGYDEALSKRRQEKVLRDQGYSRNDAKRIIAARYK